MRAVVQRVSEASVMIEGKVKSRIDIGYMILLGVAEGDTKEDAAWLINKIMNLRIFSDDEGLMNLSLKEVKGNALIISQFTLLAKTKKGNRPSFIKAAKPDVAIPMYESFLKDFSTMLGKDVGSGEFGADMKVSLVNDGPVTILLDTKNKE